MFKIAFNDLINNILKKNFKLNIILFRKYKALNLKKNLVLFFLLNFLIFLKLSLLLTILFLNKRIFF